MLVSKDQVFDAMKREGVKWYETEQVLKRLFEQEWQEAILKVHRVLHRYGVALQIVGTPHLVHFYANSEKMWCTSGIEVRIMDGKLEWRRN